MTFDTKKLEPVRKKFLMAEVYLDRNDPALDAEFALQLDSYATPKTTEDARAYTGVDFIMNRYADQAVFGVPGGHFPNLTNVSSNAPRIDPGKSVGFRASARFTVNSFVTKDASELPIIYQDSRIAEGDHNQKVVTRNFLKNRRSRIITGYNPMSYDESNCQIENYIIDDVSFSSDGQDLNYSLLDELILIEKAKAKYPALSTGVLTLAMTIDVLTLAFYTEITQEYGAEGATGYICIGSEIMGYTVDAGEADMTITRAQLGTLREEHSIGDTIQKVEYIDNQNIMDILTTLLTVGAGIPADRIPTSDYNTLKADALKEYYLTRPLYKPFEVKKLINELIVLAGLSVYQDVITRKIIVVATPDFSTPVIAYNEVESIESGSTTVKPMYKEQVTRQLVRWAKKNPTSNDDDTNFNKAILVSDGVAESEANENNISEGAEIKTEWLQNTTAHNSLGTALAQRTVNRNSKVPIEISFDTDVSYVGAVAGGNMWLGSIFSATTSRILNGALQPETTTFQAVSIKNKGGDKYTVTGLSYIAAAPPTADFFISSDKVDYNLADDPLFAAILSEVKEYVVVINSGVKLTASTTAEYVFDQGVFPVGAKLKLIILGRLYGKGGSGGQGGSISYNDEADPAITFGTANDGNDGGDCMNFTTDAIIENGFGLIAAGGGGAGGFGGGGLLSGDGGGAGQGYALGGAAGNVFNITDGGGISAGDAGGASGIAFSGVIGGGEYGEDGEDNAATGGLSGVAIRKNGNTVTITTGNNSLQILGAVI